MTRLGVALGQMPSVLLTVLLLSQAPLEAEVAERAPSRNWLPLQGDVAFNALFGPTTARTLSVYLGYAEGFAVQGPGDWVEGPFWGIGLRGLYGSVDLPACRTSIRCGERFAMGPSVRTGRAFGGRPEPLVWPDTLLFVQLTGLVGATHLAGPTQTDTLTSMLLGTRFDLGLNSVGWSREYFKVLVNGGVHFHQLEDIFVYLFLLASTVINHVEASVEWTYTSVDEHRLRVGFSVGTGF